MGGDINFLWVCYLKTVFLKLLLSLSTCFVFMGFLVDLVLKRQPLLLLTQFRNFNTWNCKPKSRHPFFIVVSQSSPNVGSLVLSLVLLAVWALVLGPHSCYWLLTRVIIGSQCPLLWHSECPELGTPVLLALTFHTSRWLDSWRMMVNVLFCQVIGLEDIRNRSHPVT